MDDIQVTEKGLVIEGAVLISTLYVSSDDRVPYAVLEDAIPFQQIVEVPGLNENSRYQVQNYVEQLSVNMLDSETLEASGDAGNGSEKTAGSAGHSRVYGSA